jgi:energy-coupling factor transporter ATP-binding protein EcfA2
MKTIQRLRLDNFLSFAPGSEAFDLQSLNVLIGPNGSGKSNLIEAFELLRSTPTDFAAAIREGGGPAEWIWKGPSRFRRRPWHLSLITGGASREMLSRELRIWKPSPRRTLRRRWPTRHEDEGRLPQDPPRQRSFEADQPGDSPEALSPLRPLQAWARTVRHVRHVRSTSMGERTRFSHYHLEVMNSAVDALNNGAAQTSFLAARLIAAFKTEPVVEREIRGRRRQQGIVTKPIALCFKHYLTH